MGTARFQRGDPVIFAKTKFSARPGPRAEEISPASHGETYSYLVKKFWTVVYNTDGRLLVQTRRGKRHWIDLDDPALRVPTWWEQLRYRERFPAVSDSESVRENARSGEIRQQT
jgi:hypothetical protein